MSKDPRAGADGPEREQRGGPMDPTVPVPPLDGNGHGPGEDAAATDGEPPATAANGDGNGRPPSEPSVGTGEALVSRTGGPADPGAGTARAGADQRRRDRRARKELRRRERRDRPRLKKLRFAFVVIGLALLAMVSWIFGVLMAVSQDLPDLEARAQYDRAENSVVLASDGKTELAMLTGNQRRILIESDEISPVLKHAVVAIEDERFYEHRGIDYMGIARALREDIVAGSAVQGGSTITQQFVKNALEAQSSRTVLQKLREAALAYQVERQWSKDKILTNYLNNIYFGEGAYGVEAAARTYFGSNHPGCGEDGNRCAEVLQVEEAAMLAGMISSPTMYSPKASPEAAVERRNVVLAKMRELGMLEVSEDEYQEMLAAEPPEPEEVEPPKEDSLAPYFTDWLRQQMVDKYGAGEAFGGGLRVTSTLDIELQQAAQDAVEGRIGGLGPTAAVVVLENGTANVLAMVGGNDFDENPFNLATNGRRQPGSAFKPFTLLAALENGRSPSDVYSSQPIEIPFKARVPKKKGNGTKLVNDLYEVNNYDDSYLGSASIATATTYSDNSVYAQLGTDVGTDEVADTAAEMGIHSPIPENPAMILGGLKRGVTPLEMAYAYNTLANRGERVSGTMASRGNGRGPVAIAKVENADGELVADDLGADGENEREQERVIDEGVADQAIEILHTVVTSGTGRRAQVGDDYIWGKTGTTDNNADAWFVGANEEITVAVWIGHADGGIPMETEFGGLPVDGGTIPALLWNDIVTAWSSLQDERNPDEAEEEVTTETVVPEPAPVPEEVVPEPEPTPVPEPEQAPDAPAGGGQQQQQQPAEGGGAPSADG